MTAQLKQDQARTDRLEGLPGESLFCIKRTWKLTEFYKLHPNKPQDVWNNYQWTDDAKGEFFGLNAQALLAKNPNAAFQQKYPIPNVKHGGEVVIIWGCSAASGPVRLAIIELLCIPECSRDKYKAICLTAKAWSKLGHKRGQ